MKSLTIASTFRFIILLTIIGLIVIASILNLHGKIDFNVESILRFKTLSFRDSHIKRWIINNTTIPTVKVHDVDCIKLFENDKVEIDRAKSLNRATVNVSELFGLNASAVSEETCDVFKRSRGYISQPLTVEEAEFPIAYSILVYKDVIMFERLLRAIYRPQNYYCVHVDKSTDSSINAAVINIVKCFANVFIPVFNVDVNRAGFSVLAADLLCMKRLLAYRTWRYFINLTGQEFPLKTNWEIVKILKAFNGSNNVDGTLKFRERDRYVGSLARLPVNATVTKGSVHIIATRSFVDFAVNNVTALAFLAWTSKTMVPDETYFSSLNHSPQLGVPGSYKGDPDSRSATGSNYQFLARFKNWMGADLPCAGKYVNSICVFGVGDLSTLAGRRELFANKFHADFEPAAFDCMEEWIFNKTRDDLRTGAEVVDVAFYSRLSHVGNHVP